ncbi:MAG: hypothetical protein HYT47_01630 [Candidatus Vogelbacteria bacterium]|nr:hypothetical protein [Candidatus Vogelbacteria bacterium]
MEGHEIPVTTGDHYNIACPHPDCGQINHHVTRGIQVEDGKATRFSKPCRYCGRTIFYEVTLIRAVTATIVEHGFLNAFPPRVEATRYPFKT